MIRVDVQNTFKPIIGSELRSKELDDYIMKNYELNLVSIWKNKIYS